jgi:hypothetical protein
MLHSRLLVGLSVVAACVASVATLVLTAPSAGAATVITVDAASDLPADASHCLPTPFPGACSLRDAFAAASSGGPAAGDDVIMTVAPSVTAITLTQGELLYDGGTGGAHSLSIAAPGTTVTQTTADRVMHSPGTGLFTISGFTLTGGNTTGQGGAIEAGGAVDVADSALVGNTASDGGAIDLHGDLTLTRSTLADNRATSFGGAVESERSDAAVITNSTIAGNQAGALGGGLGGVSDLTLVYSTIAGNSSPRGANIDDNNGVLTSFGSVVARPGTGVNCSGLTATTSHGFNLEDDAAASCGFSTSAGDLAPGTNPALAALGDHGGPGPTMLPSPGSPLLDAIPLASCQADGAKFVTTDERGVTRPQGTGCDIGAVEVEASTFGTPPSEPPAAAPLSLQPLFTG